MGFESQTDARQITQKTKQQRCFPLSPRENVRSIEEGIKMSAAHSEKSGNEQKLLISR